MRSASNTDILYGRKPVQLFFEKSPRKPVRLWLDRRMDKQMIEKFSRLARGRSAQITLVDPGQMDRITDQAVHQGVAVEAEPLKIRPLADFLGSLPARVSLLILDSVTDPQNFGAVCRTAEGFGMNGLIFETKHAPPLGGAAYKASAGAIEFIPLYIVPNLMEGLRLLKAKKVTLVGLDANANTSLSTLGQKTGSPPDRIAFVLGSEGRGIRPPIKSLCDLLCSIPMTGQIGSLNVSAAAAAACFWRILTDRKT